MSEIVIVSDKGKISHGYKGDSIQIRLQENPNTGYVWIPDPFDDKITKLQGSEFIPDNQHLIGPGGARTFNLMAISLGILNDYLNLTKNTKPKVEVVDNF